MAFEGDPRHLTSEQIQEFLDRQLPREEEASVQEHLSACPHCQAELEAWGLLFSDLGSLPELDPGRVFHQEVMGRAPTRAPEKIPGWRAARNARKQAEAHIPAGSIQDYLENLLPPQPAARLEAHLTSCTSCQSEVHEWRELFGALPPLRHFAPEPGFAERVMAEVLVPAPVPVRSGSLSSLPGRAVAWARSALPQTRHGWAVAGGMASAPTITVVTLLYLLFSRPLLTPGNFVSYLLWKGSAFFDALLGAASGLVVESGTLSRVASFMEPVTQSPLLLGFGGLVFSLFSAGALWVLYRNLFASSSDDRHARARV
ncbi:MAG: hypothetical protein HKO65_11155 [Gemmatimonadetes bacterium]|nr:zf-HC2 domain-containing protein [Gemmatimonadota bacterium]NNM05634.1 hypothetical protein [Gemmatimonadota bacterium]